MKAPSPVLSAEQSPLTVLVTPPNFDVPFHPDTVNGRSRLQGHASCAKYLKHSRVRRRRPQVLPVENCSQEATRARRPSLVWNVADALEVTLIPSPSDAMMGW